MRTTIQLPDDQKARLLALAASRGERGCSKVVGEAVARYLDPPAAPHVDAMMLAPLSDWQRERLRALAASRGDDGISRVLREAVTAYLDAHERREPTRSLVARALGLIGALMEGPHTGLELVARVARMSRDRFARARA